MKDTETKLTCVKLRAQGKSLATIAGTVGVRRQTVANWLKEHEEEVENLKAIELDALRRRIYRNEFGERAAKARSQRACS
jgi:lambda repressor-like predicted transcriptional regulator